jgi:hypothetical protein
MLTAILTGAAIVLIVFAVALKVKIDLMRNRHDGTPRTPRPPA